MTGDWRKFHNGELHDFPVHRCTGPPSIGVMISDAV